MVKPPHDRGRQATLTVVNADVDERPWLTLSEAAGASGLDREAVRPRARRGLIPRRRDNRGQWLVQLPPDLDHGHDRGPDRGPDHGQETALTMVGHGQEVVADLLAEVAELRHALGRTEGELAAKDALADELRAALAKADTESG